MFIAEGNSSHSYTFKFFFFLSLNLCIDTEPQLQFILFLIMTYYMQVMSESVCGVHTGVLNPPLLDRGGKEVRIKLN